MSSVHLVVPDGVHDHTRPSGGNVYDLRLRRGLTGCGWRVREHVVPGSWPQPSENARTALGAVLARIPDRSVVVVDGLVGSSAPDVLLPETTRLRLVLLVHMPLGLDSADTTRGRGASVGERAVLRRASAVVTTSGWTRSLLLDRYALDGDRVHVAEPGVDAVEAAVGSPGGGSLLCVAAVSAHKGHQVLLSALAALGDRDWTCHLVGSLERDPAFVHVLRGQARADGIDGRLRFHGPLVGRQLDVAYARADLLVLASYAETYGMVVTEALARGLPVVATTVGGVPHALGRAPDGTPPGLLVAPGDPVALAVALRGWLDDAGLRETLRTAALDRRPTLGDWDATARTVATVLSRVAA